MSTARRTIEPLRRFALLANNDKSHRGIAADQPAQHIQSFARIVLGLLAAFLQKGGTSPSFTHGMMRNMPNARSRIDQIDAGRK
jgi:hypothetical protein